MRYAMLVVLLLALGGLGFLLTASAEESPPPPPVPTVGCQCGTKLQMRIMRHLDLSGGGGATREAEAAGSEDIVVKAGDSYDLPELYTKGSDSAYVDIFIEPVEPAGTKCSYQVSTTSTHNALHITYPDGRTEAVRYCPPGLRRAFVGGTRPHGETFLGGRDVPSSGSATWTASLRCAPQCGAFPCSGGCVCATGQFTINIVK